MNILVSLAILTCSWNLVYSGVVTWNFPWDKAKVNYHHQRICLNVNGVDNCINKNKEPGDAKELAKMFNVVHEYQAEAGGTGSERGGTEPEAGGTGSERGGTEPEAGGTALREGVDLDAVIDDENEPLENEEGIVEAISQVGIAEEEPESQFDGDEEDQLSIPDRE